MEEMASTIRGINHCNGNYRRQAEKSPSVALRRSRGRRDLRHASRRRRGQGLQEGRRKTSHFSPQVNVTYGIYILRQGKQKDGETLYSFHTRLRSQAKTCNFANPDKEIKEQIILNCRSNSLRRKTLRELDLAGLMKAGTALKLSERQAKDFESPQKKVKPLKQGTQAQAKGKQRSQQNNHESRKRYQFRKQDGKDEK